MEWLEKLREQFRREPEKVAFQSEEAQRLLENEMIKEFFEVYPKTLQEAIFNTDIHDVETREEMYRLARVCKRFKQHFDYFITAGAMAKDLMEDTTDAG